MSNTLVVYYSLTGNTRQIAEAIAAALDADLEVIEDTFNRDTVLGRPRSAIEGLLGLRSSITPPKHDLSEYDLVVVGTPVCACVFEPTARLARARSVLLHAGRLWWEVGTAKHGQG